MGEDGLALNRSRIDFACWPPSFDLPTEGIGEIIRPSASGRGGLRCENSSVDLGLAFVPVGVCLTIVGADGLAGAIGFGGDGFAAGVLPVGGSVRGVEARFRISARRRKTSFVLCVLGFEAAGGRLGFGESLRSAMVGPDDLPCENRSMDLGLVFVAVGVCLTIVGADGLVGAASFGGDGFVGGVLVGVGEDRGVVACSRSCENK
jgi:hypothetical protein